jgi:serine/threonine protein kinase/Flp pilus assembly protein TadD
MSTSALIGTVIDRKYELLSIVGVGGTGVVYHAYHQMLEREVAIKILHPEFAEDASTRARFQREFLACASLDHECIVKVHSAGETAEGQLFFVMDLLEGQSLAEKLKQSEKLTPRDFASIFNDVLAGLAYAHEHGIAHRDLKPENIILLNDGHARIVDFGTAKILKKDDQQNVLESTCTKTGTIAGTSLYMSPEQCEGRPVDHRCDIYSTGGVMYLCLTGRRPVDGETALEIMYNHLNQAAPKDVKDLPCGLDKLVGKCLQKEPANRYQSVRELQSDFQDVVQRLAKAPRQEHVGQQPRTVLIALLVVAAAIGIAVRVPSMLREMSARHSVVKNSLPITTPGFVERCRKLAGQNRNDELIADSGEWLQTVIDAPDKTRLEVYMLRATACRQLDRYDEARKSLTKAYELAHNAPQRATVAIETGDLGLIQQSNLEADLDRLCSAIKALEQSPRTELSEGLLVRSIDCTVRLCALLGRPLQAGDLILQAIAYSPKNEITRYELKKLLCLTYIQSNNTAAAKSLLREIITQQSKGTLSPYQRHFWEQIGDMCQQVGDLDGAQNALSLVLQLMPKSARERYRTVRNLAGVLCTRGQFEDAEKLYASVFEDPEVIPNAERVLLAIDRSVNYFNLKQDELAMRCLQDGLNTARKCEYKTPIELLRRKLAQLTRISASRGRLAEVKAALGAAAESSQDKFFLAQILSVLATLAQEEEQGNGAYSALLERALQAYLSSSDPKCWIQLMSVLRELIACKVEQNDYDSAEQMLLKVEKRAEQAGQKENRLDVVRQRMQLFVQRNMLNEAADVAQKAISFGSDPYIRCLLHEQAAHLQALARHYDDALANFQQARSSIQNELNPVKSCAALSLTDRNESEMETERGNFSGARKLIKNALARWQSRPASLRDNFEIQHLYTRQGINEYMAGNIQEAISSVRTAREFCSTRTIREWKLRCDCTLLLGRWLAETNKFDESQKVFSTLMNGQAPDSIVMELSLPLERAEYKVNRARITIGLAETKARQGQLAEAEKLFVPAMNVLRPSGPIPAAEMQTAYCGSLLAGNTRPCLDRCIRLCDENRVAMTPLMEFMPADRIGFDSMKFAAAAWRAKGDETRARLAEEDVRKFAQALAKHQ